MILIKKSQISSLYYMFVFDNIELTVHDIIVLES